MTSLPSSIGLRLRILSCIVFVSAHLGGCANPQNSLVGSDLSQPGAKISASQAGDIGDANKIAARYPVSQMPHTMMKKPLASGSLSSRFGYRPDPKGTSVPRLHKGVDYAAPRGTAIYAAAEGVIDKIYVSNSYGKYIRIAHENNFHTAYAHLNAFVDGLKKGTRVTRGQIIGQVGNTGRSSGPHLHFELIHAGKFIDPLFGIGGTTIAKSQ